MTGKILTWNEFNEVCKADAYNWFNNGYTAEELTENDVLSEYPDDYFDADTEWEVDINSHCFTPHEFYEATIGFMSELY